MKRILIVLMISMMLTALVACGQPLEVDPLQTTDGEEGAATAQADEALQEQLSSLLGEDDGAAQAVSSESDTQIAMSGGSAEITGAGAEFRDGGIVITEAGSYQLSGNLDGGVTVRAAGDVTLILAGAEITNSNGPAILIEQAESAVITLAENTENTLADGGESEYDAALYGVVSFTVNGSGALDVNGNVEEGIASDGNITFDGGRISIVARDDGINGSEDGVSQIIINDGAITVNAGGDGIDSNGSITMTGGSVFTYGAVADANGGLDADGDIVISGGVVFATGANIELPTQDSQDYITLRFDSVQNENTLITMSDGTTEIFGALVPQTYQMLLYTSPDLQAGVEYEVYVDGELAGTVTTDSAAQGGGNPGGDAPGMTDGQPPEGGRVRPGDGQGDLTDAENQLMSE